MVPYKISITCNFHYDRRRRFLTPGDYRVPQDVSRAVADDAVKAGAATRVEPVRQTRKRAVPADKAGSAAPDDKTDLVGRDGHRRSAGAVSD